MERALDYYQEALMMRTLITNTQVYVLQRNNAVKILQRWYRNKLKAVIARWDKVEEVYCMDREIKVTFCLGTYKTCIVYFDDMGEQIGLKIMERDPKTWKLSVWKSIDEKLYAYAYRSLSGGGEKVLVALAPPTDDWIEYCIDTGLN